MGIPLEKDFALDQIGRLFPNEWKHLTPEDIRIDHISVGNCNSVYLVENVKDMQSKEPRKLIVRMYGGNFLADKPDLMPQTVEGESLIFFEASRHRICARLYGLFKGGRVEEYIEMRTMKQKDVKDLELTRELARSLVKFHYLDLPLPRPSYDFFDVHMTLLKKFQESGNEQLRSNQVFRELIGDPTVFCDYDYLKVIQWLNKLHDPNMSRPVLMHWDFHNMNIILTKNPSDYGGRRAFFCDFEFTCYNTRCKDLGQFFLIPMITVDDLEGDLTVNPFPVNEEYTKVFLTEYQEALGESGNCPDFDPNGKDSYDNLLLEAMIGNLNSFLSFLLFTLSKVEVLIGMSPKLFSNFIYQTFMSMKETIKALEVTFPKFTMDKML